MREISTGTAALNYLYIYIQKDNIGSSGRPIGSYMDPFQYHSVKSMLCSAHQQAFTSAGLSATMFYTNLLLRGRSGHYTVAGLSMPTGGLLPKGEAMTAQTCV